MLSALPVKATLQSKVQVHLLRCCQPLILRDVSRLSFPLHPYNMASTGKKLPKGEQKQEMSCPVLPAEAPALPLECTLAWRGGAGLRAVPRVS